jgi:hypothetical protein
MDAKVNNTEPRPNRLNAMSHFFLTVGCWIILSVGGAFLASQLVAWITGTSAETFMAIAQGEDDLSETGRAALFAIQFVSALAGFILAPLLLTKLFRADTASYLRTDKRISGAQGGMAVLLILASIPVITFLVTWNSSFDYALLGEAGAALQSLSEANEKMLAAMLDSQSMWVVIASFLVLVVIPAIGEELLFRGILLNQFYGLFRNKHVAVWASTLIFVLLHVKLTQFVPMMFLSLIFGYMVVYSGSLWTSITAHFVNNALYLVHHFAFGDQQSPLSDDYPYPIYAVVLSALAMVGIWWWFYRKSARSTEVVFPNHYE